MPTPIEDFIIQVRERTFVRIPKRQEVSDIDVTRAIYDALNEYQRFRPRLNVKSSITQTAGSENVPLPSDFASTNYNNLSYALTGAYFIGNWFITNDINIFDSNTAGVRVLSGNRITTIGFGSTYWGTSEILVLSTTITTDDNGLYILRLREPATSSVTRDLTYNALHKIDATANTVPLADRDIIIDYSVARLQESLLITLALEQESKRNSSILGAFQKDIERRRKHFFSRLRGFGTRMPS